MQIESAKDSIVYQKAYELGIEIFAVIKGFPAEEKYSFIDQIRRSYRSVCTNLREAWAKRRYKAHFVSKLTDYAIFVKKCGETGAMAGRYD
jgi:four helix bundle protein